MKNRLQRFVRLWIDLFNRHQLLDHASSIAFQVLKSVIPLTLLGLAILGATGEEHVWRETIAPAIKPHLQLPAFHAIDYGVEKIFTTNSAGLIVFASFLSLWYISGAVRAVTETLLEACLAPCRGCATPSGPDGSTRAGRASRRPRSA